MTYTTIGHGPSRSFPDGDPFIAASVDGGDVLVHLGAPTPGTIAADPSHSCTLIELGTECLGLHTGEALGEEGDTRIGFARWRVGDDDPSDLVELVVQPRTSADALAAALWVFEDAGLAVSVCADRSGRILDRLLRPYLNDALRALDDGVATAPDLDKTVRLGLGYPAGPLELLQRSGMHHHLEVTAALHAVYGTVAFAPPRRAVVASRAPR